MSQCGGGERRAERDSTQPIYQDIVPGCAAPYIYILLKGALG